MSDGADRLCAALYGKNRNPREYVEKYRGGSEAPMLYDAADEIERLRDALRWRDAETEPLEFPCFIRINVMLRDGSSEMRYWFRRAEDGVDDLLKGSPACVEWLPIPGGNTE